MADKCSLELKEKLKDIYQGTQLDTKIEELDIELQNIVKEAQEQGVDPLEYFEKRVSENIRAIEMDAMTRMLQIESYNRAFGQVTQFDNIEKGIESTLHALPGERYNATAGNIESTVKANRRLRTQLIMRGMNDIEGGIDRALSGEFDDYVMKLMYEEISEADMGTVPREAIAIYKALKRHNDFDYQQKINVGANVQYKKNRLFKRRHNAEGMKILGKQEWVKTALRTMDEKKILRNITAGMDESKLAKVRDDPMTFLRNYMEDKYDEILTRENKRGIGISDDFTEIRFTGQKAALEKKMSFEFKDAASELEYHRTVNGKSITSMVLEDVRDNSAYIGSATVYGPSPKTTFMKLMEAGPDLNTKKLEQKYLLASGRRAGVADSMGAKAAEKLRKLADITKLGTAIFSTAPDFALGAMVVSSTTGRNYFQTLGELFVDTVKAIPEGSRREVQQRFAVLTDDMLYGSLNSRVGESSTITTAFDEFSWASFKKSIADGNMRESLRQGGNAFDQFHQGFMKLTGLPGQSEVIRTALAKNMGMHIADISGQSFGDIFPKTRELMERFGINEREWDIIRKLTTELEDGSKVIEVDSILGLSGKEIGMTNKTDSSRFIEGLAMNYSSMLTFIAEHGSPTPGVKNKYWVDAIDPNTAGGILARFVGQYKSFSLSVIDTLREAYGPEFDTNRIMKMNAALITGMGLAYLGTSAKNIMLGKEPPNPNEPGTWKDMALRAGMGGLYADFLTTDYNSPWRSLGADMAGPAIGTAEDILKGSRGVVDYIMANAADTEAAEAKQKQKAIRKTLYALEATTPSILFTKSLINKNFYDMLHKSMNTGAKRK